MTGRPPPTAGAATTSGLQPVCCLQLGPVAVDCGRRADFTPNLLQTSIAIPSALPLQHHLRNTLHIRVAPLQPACPFCPPWLPPTARPSLARPLPLPLPLPLQQPRRPASLRRRRPWCPSCLCPMSSATPLPPRPQRRTSPKQSPTMLDPMQSSKSTKTKTPSLAARMTAPPKPQLRSQLLPPPPTLRKPMPPTAQVRHYPEDFLLGFPHLASQRSREPFKQLLLIN